MIYKSTKWTKDFNIACNSKASVLILGPTGSGKSDLAEKIHALSVGQNQGPFVAVNLASLSSGTLESELFGHERGAFTGADRSRKGLIESAQGGTLFLDEIGELAANQQVRLLEFLQTGKITKIGSNEKIHINTRVIAATNRDLSSEVQQGKFREDLFQRLRVIQIKIAPLTERLDEFGEFVHTFIEEFSSLHQKKILKLEHEYASSLEAYSWPGNLRELRHVLEYSVLSSNNGILKCEDFPSWFLEESSKVLANALNSTSSIESKSIYSYREAMSDFENKYLKQALLKNGGRINLTARLLGISKGTLLKRIQEYGLRMERAEQSL